MVLLPLKEIQALRQKLLAFVFIMLYECHCVNFALWLLRLHPHLALVCLCCHFYGFFRDGWFESRLLLHVLSPFLSEVQDDVFVSHVQSLKNKQSWLKIFFTYLVQTKTSLNEFFPVDGPLAHIKLLELGNDRRDDIRNVSWDGFDVNCVDRN